MHKQTKAEGALLLVSVFWGLGYLLSDIVLTQLDVFSSNGIRFVGAFVIAYIIFFKRMKNVTKETVKYAAIVGVTLFVLYFTSTTALLYTSISNVGFLSSLAIVFTPILMFFIKKEVPSKKTIFIILTAVVGIALLSVSDQFTIALGDILAIIAALSYAVMLIIIDKAVVKEEVDALQLGVFQLGFTGVYSVSFAIALGSFTIPTEPVIIWSLLGLTIFATGAAFIIQTVAQQFTDPVRVGIIFSTEPVFAGVFAFVFAGEVLTGRAYLGAIILIACVLLMEVDLTKLINRRK